MVPHAVSVYCLPNIRNPWVLVFEPHPWGRGALRVAEESAVLVHYRAPTKPEIEWLAGSVTHWCVTFNQEAELLAYEERAEGKPKELQEGIDSQRAKVNAVLEKVKEKQLAKQRKERRRRLPTVADPIEEYEDDPEDLPPEDYR